MIDHSIGQMLNIRIQNEIHTSSLSEYDKKDLLNMLARVNTVNSGAKAAESSKRSLGKRKPRIPNLNLSNIFNRRQQLEDALNIFNRDQKFINFKVSDVADYKSDSSKSKLSMEKFEPTYFNC